MTSRTSHLLACSMLGLAVVVSGLATPAWSQPADNPPSRRGPTDQADVERPRRGDAEQGDQERARRGPATPPAVQSLEGTVAGFNTDPRGQIESLMLKTDKESVQINFPPQIGQAMASKVAVGDAVKAQVISHPQRGPGGPGGPGMAPPPDGGERMAPPPPPPGDDAAGAAPRRQARDRADRQENREGVAPQRPQGDFGGPRGGMVQPDHPVFELVQLTDAKGNQYQVPRPQDRQTVKVEGTVKSINYDRRGVANALVLGGGEFILLPPGQIKALKLEAGAKVSVEGFAEPVGEGRTVIHAQSINGNRIAPRQAGPRNRMGPDDDGGGMGPTGGRENAPRDRQGSQPRSPNRRPDANP